MLNLSGYGFIKKYLENIVRQRLAIKGYTRGILSADLLVNNKLDLERLNNALQIGEVNCINFKSIFRIKTECA